MAKSNNEKKQLKAEVVRLSESLNSEKDTNRKLQSELIVRNED